MQNWVYVICMYVWMVCMPLNTHAVDFFPLKKHGFLGLTSISSDTTELSKSYLKLGL